MQGKDIIKAVRTLLQDSQYDAAVILQAANWFVYELANNNKLRMFEDSETLTASAGDTTLAFPDKSLAWTGIWLTSPSSYDLADSFIEYNLFMREHPNFATATASRAEKWTMFGTGARFATPLSADSTFQFDFVREPKPMDKEASKCEIPGRYIELISRGAKARILEIEEDYDFASQERDIMEPLQIAFVRNESRGGGKTRPTVIGTRRRKRGSDW